MRTPAVNRTAPSAPLWAWVAVSLVAVGLLSGCDSQTMNEEDPPGHYLYISDLGYDEVHVFNPADTAIVETLRGFGSVWNLAASPDGRTIYVGTRENYLSANGALFAVVAGSWKREVVLEAPADVFTAPGHPAVAVAVTPGEPGRPVALIGPRSSDVRLIDTLDVLESTGFDYQSLVLHPERPVFLTLDSAHRLFAYDYERGEVVRTYSLQLNEYFTHLALSEDGRLLFVAGGPVLDLERDTIVGFTGGNPIGSLALVPGQQKLYVTDPGAYLRIDVPLTGKIDVYNTSTYEPMGEIDVMEVYPYPTKQRTDQVVLADGGGTAYVSNWRNVLYVIDTATDVATGALPFPEWTAMRPVILALGPINQP